MNISEVAQIVNYQLGNGFFRYVKEIKEIDSKTYNVVMVFDKLRFEIPFDVEQKALDIYNVEAVIKIIKTEIGLWE